jgi:hypothetical protein
VAELDVAQILAAVRGLFARKVRGERSRHDG